MRKLLFIFIILFCILLLACFTFPLPNPPIEKIQTLAPKDAVLVHSYWFSQKGNGPVTLSLRSKLAIDAAAILYRNGKVKYIVITAGPIWGKAYPSLGKKMAEALYAQGIPKEHIILKEDAMDTYEEIAEFLQIAHQHKWKMLADIAAAPHDITIPTLYATLKGKATYLTLENIIQAEGTPEEKDAVQLLISSWYENTLSLYERVIRLTLFIDPHYHLLGIQAKNTRNKKTTYGGIPFFPVDKYDL